MFYFSEPTYAKEEFLNLVTSDIWGQIIPGCSSCSVHYSRSSNIPALYPLYNINLEGVVSDVL